MTLSETKALIRHARGLIREWRARVNSSPSFDALPEEIRLNSADYDALEWGMAHLLKGWRCDYDADGQPIPGTEKLIRLNFLFTLTADPTAFYFKGIPVRRVMGDAL